MAGYVITPSTADSVTASALSASSGTTSSVSVSVSMSDLRIGHDDHDCGGTYVRFFKPLFGFFLNLGYFETNETKRTKFAYSTGTLITATYRTAIPEHEKEPLFDSFLSFLGLLILSPIFLLIMAAIKIDDPAPVFFMQKRVGKDKHFFMLHKFRSMAMNTPHDMPTHLLANPEQYITRVGRFLRRSSLDEIPQIWDIFRGKMSIIGPRPALWNQADLIARRDRWKANDVMPGLTGLAQISGRDELEIEDKARLDGEYTKALRAGWTQGLLMDMKCFFGTVLPVLRSDGVVEGKTVIHQ